ncbi:MAG: LacI family DNA-binding transcriptional regulator [Pseudomonadota bacterium]
MDTKPTTRLEDLAKRAGVSISTASRALNDSPAVNVRTKQKIWKLARELDYPFRAYMPAGPIGANATISIVVPRPQSREGRMADPFFFELLAGIGDAARERGCDILLSYIAPSSYEELANAMSTSRSDGVIFLGQSTLHEAFNRLAEVEDRFVVWGAALPEQAYCSVGSDNIAGGRRATSHLARLGRKKIIFLGDSDAPEAGQRMRGYREGLELSGLTYDDRLVVPAHFQVASARAVVETLIAEKADFDAIVAASDLIALGAIQAIRRAGLSVPDDIAVVGYDNVPFGVYAEVPLSTIDQDTSKAGRVLVSKLLDSSGQRGPDDDRIPAELIIRASCGAP